MLNLLIVDDEAAVRRVIHRFLSMEGYHIEEAADAAEALRCIATAPPTVAIVDVHLPGANGLWLADQIRAVSPATAIVLVTGDADVPPSESLRSGIAAYILKPAT